LKIISDKKGGKGILPLGCLPFWGREWVTLIAAADDFRITEKKRISTGPVFKKNENNGGG
jgi:hypothetical protein